MSDNNNTVLPERNDLEVIVSGCNKRKLSAEEVDALQRAVSAYQDAEARLRHKSASLASMITDLHDRTESQNTVMNRAISYYESRHSEIQRANRELLLENNRLRAEVAQHNTRLLSRPKHCMVCFTEKLSVTNYCSCSYEMCAECVVNLLESSRGQVDGRFRCPQCRKGMSPDNCGITNLSVTRNNPPIPDYNSDTENALTNIRDAFQTGERIIQRVNENGVPETTLNFPELTDIHIRGTAQIQDNTIDAIVEGQARNIGAAMNAAARLFNNSPSPPNTPPRIGAVRPPTPYRID